MKLVIAGGSGYIGQEIVRYYRSHEVEIVILSRSEISKQQTRQQSKANVMTLSWSEVERDPQPLEGAKAFVNLSGASINCLWTSRHKQLIERSRIEATRRMAALLSRLHHKPEVVIHASAIGFYGTSLSETYDETSIPPANDFLADVVRKWEEESKQFDVGRVVQLRIGIVLGTRGGALPPMTLPYRIGIGGRIGSGKQWMSWIHVDDLVRIIDACIADERLQGAVNATAPHPVQNDRFGKALASAMKRPHWVPLPSIALKLALGEMSMLLLQGQHVVPQKLRDIGFPFQYETIEEALRQLLNDGDSDRVKMK